VSEKRETPPGKPVASKQLTIVDRSNERNNPQGKPGALPDFASSFSASVER
jgi:hypothetical protein